MITEKALPGSAVQPTEAGGWERSPVREGPEPQVVLAAGPMPKRMSGVAFAWPLKADLKVMQKPARRYPGELPLPAVTESLQPEPTSEIAAGP